MIYIFSTQNINKKLIDIIFRCNIVKLSLHFKYFKCEKSQKSDSYRRINQR